MAFAVLHASCGVFKKSISGGRGGLLRDADRFF